MPCIYTKAIEVYDTIKAKDKAFEVIFISSDRVESSFEEYFSTMSWLALPFGYKRKESLSRLFKVIGNPMLVTLGPTGHTLTTAARDFVMSRGADSYPFTQERLKEIEEGYKMMAKDWPEKVKHDLHDEHELELARCLAYTCDGCSERVDKFSLISVKSVTLIFIQSVHWKKMQIRRTVRRKGQLKRDCDGDVCYKA